MMKEILTTKITKATKGWNILAHKLPTFVSFVVIFDFLVWLLLYRARLKMLYHLHAVLSNQFISLLASIQEHIDKRIA